ncbi:MAG: AAA family ATPase [Phycisphaerae bacterium]
MPTQIAFVNGKGGVGKTTATTLIAAAFRSANIAVSIDDRDPQLSASTAAGIFDIPLGDSSDTVLIDTAPAIQMPSTLDAIQTADLVILVTSPSPLDLATTAATAKWIQAQRTGETRLLFNLVQTNNRFFDEMADIAREIPFPALKNHLVRRTAYQVAQIAGWKSIPAIYREEIIKVTMEIAQAIPKPQNQASTH